MGIERLIARSPGYGQLAYLFESITTHCIRGRWRAALAMMVVAAATTSSALADQFPSRTIRFIVPFAAGSITDTSARFYAQRLSAICGQSVIIENKPGANGILGVSAVLGAPADGYTILIGTTSTLATNVALYRKLSYDPLKDLAPLTTMSSAPSILIVPARSAFKGLADLIAAARKSPGALSYAVGATSYQLMGELLNERAGMLTKSIPYKGSADALNGILSDVVDFSILDTSTALASIRSNSVRALAVASEDRSSLLPDVPTAIESGVKGWVASTWVAAAVSAKTPKDILERLSAWMTQIAREPETKAFLRNIGAELMPTGPEALLELQRSNIALWQRVVANAKIERL